MLSMVIVMLGCVAMAAGDCPTAIKTLTEASYTIYETVKMLPDNMMAGNCMLNVMYSATTNQVEAQINGTMFMNMTMPMPMGAPAAGGSAAGGSAAGGSGRKKRQVGAAAPVAAAPMMSMMMTNSTMFFIIDPMKCTSMMWGNITSVLMAMEYLASIRTGALVVTIGAPLSMESIMALAQYTTMMPMKMMPMNMPTTMPAGAMNIADVMILQVGYPEKTMMMQFMSGMSSMFQYRITGNTMNLMITSQMPTSMMMPPMMPNSLG